MENRPPLPPWGAVVLSFWVPGMGQFAAGRRLAGVLWLLTHLTGVSVLVWTLKSVALPGHRVTFIGGGVLAVFWIGMLAHAYRVCPRPAVPGTTKLWIAGGLSWLIAGVGQLCCGQWWSGVAFLLALVGAQFLSGRWALVAGLIVTAASALHLFRRHSQCALVLTTLLVRVVGALVFAVGVRTFVVEPFRVPTGAMAPTIQAGDHLFADKIVYRLRDPRRGEIVAFRTDGIADIPAPSRGPIYIKRVVGLPGERVGLRPPHVLINGKPVSIAGIEYVLLPDIFPPAKYLKTETDSVLLGPDEYFVLGDNSLHSMDSRFWGPVRRDAIIGRAVKTYWPAARVGVTFAVP